MSNYLCIPGLPHHALWQQVRESNSQTSSLCPSVQRERLSNPHASSLCPSIRPRPSQVVFQGIWNWAVGISTGIAADAGLEVSRETLGPTCALAVLLGRGFTPEGCCVCT